MHQSRKSRQLYAGGVYNKDNASYYLSGDSTWTMSPFALSGSSANVWLVHNDGQLSGSTVPSSSVTLRPVINLKSTVEITSGNGTNGNPYIIKTN